MDTYQQTIKEAMCADELCAELPYSALRGAAEGTTSEVALLIPNSLQTKVLSEKSEFRTTDSTFFLDH